MAIFKKIKSAISKVAKVAKNFIGLSPTVSNAIKQSASVVKAAPKVVSTIKSAVNLSPKSSFTAAVGENVPSFVKNTGNYGGFNAPSGSGTSASSAVPAPKSMKSGTSNKSNYSSQSYTTDLARGTALASSTPISSQMSATDFTGGGSTQYALPSAPATANYAGMVNETNASLGADGITGTFNTPVTATTGEVTAPNKSAADKYLESLQVAREKMPTQDELYSKALEESGLAEARTQMNNTQNQINSITAKMNQDLLQLRGVGSAEGVTETVYGGQQAQISREATIRLLPLQAQLAADQGNYEAAQENTNLLFNIYSKDAQNSLSFYEKQAEVIYADATAKEKEKLDENKAQKSFMNDVIKMEINNQSDLAKEFASNGNWTAYRALTSVRPPTNVNSPTFQEDMQNYREDVASIASSYGYSAPKVGGVLSELPTSIQGKIINKADSLGSSDIGKKFNATVDAINVINGIDPKSKNPADHQTVVYQFAKSLDPESVVREGEYATIAKYAQSMVSRYKKEITNAIAGTGFLSEKAIKDIQSTMNNNYNSRKPQYDNLKSEIGRVINNIAGANVANEILVDYESGLSEASPQTTSDSGGDTKVWEGVTYKIINGVWTPQ